MGYWEGLIKVSALVLIFIMFAMNLVDVAMSWL